MVSSNGEETTSTVAQSVLLYAKGIPLNVTGDDLKVICSNYTEVVSVLMMKNADPLDAHSSQWAMVRVTSDFGAQVLVQNLHGQPLAPGAPKMNWQTLGADALSSEAFMGDSLDTPSTTASGPDLSEKCDSVSPERGEPQQQPQQRHTLVQSEVEQRAMATATPTEPYVLVDGRLIQNKVVFGHAEQSPDQSIPGDAAIPSSADIDAIAAATAERVAAERVARVEAERVAMEAERAAARSKFVWRVYVTPEGLTYYHCAETGETTWDKPAYGVITSIASTEANSQRNGPQYGPPGANLFCFHLPTEWDEPELYAHFERFGKIVSARIAREPSSGRSRGYGFVSYDAVEAATKAIFAMDGFRVLGKVLHIQNKKGEEKYGPVRSGESRRRHQEFNQGLGKGNGKGQAGRRPPHERRPYGSHGGGRMFHNMDLLSEQRQQVANDVMQAAQNAAAAMQFVGQNATQAISMGSFDPNPHLRQY